jgi:hypothetical protein
MPLIAKGFEMENFTIAGEQHAGRDRRQGRG